VVERANGLVHDATSGAARSDKAAALQAVGDAHQLAVDNPSCFDRTRRASIDYLYQQLNSQAGSGSGGGGSPGGTGGAGGAGGAGTGTGGGAGGAGTGGGGGGGGGGGAGGAGGGGSATTSAAR
jgi:hypothetical protein